MVQIEFGPAIVILVVTLAMVLVAKALQLKLVDKDKMKRQKLRMKEKNAKLKQLTKEGNKEEAALIQKEIMQDTMEMMKGSQKLMLASFPLIIVYFILGFMFERPEGLIALFPIPTFSWWGFIPIPNLGVSMVAGWRRMYFVNYFMWYITVAIILKIREKIMDKELKEKVN